MVINVIFWTTIEFMNNIKITKETDNVLYKIQFIVQFNRNLSSTLPPTEIVNCNSNL